MVDLDEGSSPVHRISSRQQLDALRAQTAGNKQLHIKVGLPEIYLSAPLNGFVSLGGIREWWQRLE